MSKEKARISTTNQIIFVNLLWKYLCSPWSSKSDHVSEGMVWWPGVPWPGSNWRRRDNLHLDHHISGHQSTSYHRIRTFCNLSLRHIRHIRHIRHYNINLYMRPILELNLLLEDSRPSYQWTIGHQSTSYLYVSQSWRKCYQKKFFLFSCGANLWSQFASILNIVSVNTI